METLVEGLAAVRCRHGSKPLHVTVVDLLAATATDYADVEGPTPIEHADVLETLRQHHEADTGRPHLLALIHADTCRTHAPRPR